MSNTNYLIQAIQQRLARRRQLEKLKQQIAQEEEFYEDAQRENVFDFLLQRGHYARDIKIF